MVKRGEIERLNEVPHNLENNTMEASKLVIIELEN